MAALMHEWGFLIAAIFLCLLGNGFFSGGEIALLSAKRGAIEALAGQGNRRAERVKRLQDDPDTLLATVQIGVTLMGTMAGVLGGYLAKLYVEPLVSGSFLGPWVVPAVAATIIVGGGIVYVELVLGELVPKALALRYSNTAAMLVSGPVLLLERLSRVLILLLKGSTRAVLFLFGIRDPGRRTFVSEEEIKHLIREGREQGVIDDTEMQIIHSVFQFNETPVKKVMVPRPKIFALDVNTPPEDVERLIVESGFSRVPVYEESADDFIGVVYIKDALRLLERRQPLVLRKILQPVHFVPETKKVGGLLKELQKRRTHLAMVVDEHGSVTGLVTMEDLLEEIVGEIQDEYDWEERPVEKLRDGSLVVEGTTPAAELREAHQIPLPVSDEFDTVAGFMLNSLGSVPRGGEVVGVGDYRLTVVDVEKNRISKVKIEKARAAVVTPGR
jgi:putative hemolysin